jgi:hypothetical protein
VLGGPIQTVLYDLDELLARLLAAGALLGALFALNDFAAYGASPFFHVV